MREGVGVGWGIVCYCHRYRYVTLYVITVDQSISHCQHPVINLKLRVALVFIHTRLSERCLGTATVLLPSLGCVEQGHSGYRVWTRTCRV